MTTQSTIIPERLAMLDQISLDKGSHGSFDDGHCAMEVVAFLAGEGHTDAPRCASRVLRDFTISVNDSWSAEQRGNLVPFLPRMVGTAGDGQDEARSFLALDWLIRTYTPAWLDLAGLGVEAQSLRDLRRIVDEVAAKAAGPVVREAQDKASAARSAARSAAESAARSDARSDAESAARSAAWSAARSAARSAKSVAWSAARSAARSAAGSGAWSAARSAARSAADAAARSAADAAARSAAGSALAPTVHLLQASALDLLDRMIDPSAVTS